MGNILFGIAILIAAATAMAEEKAGSIECVGTHRALLILIDLNSDTTRVNGVLMYDHRHSAGGYLTVVLPYKGSTSECGGHSEITIPTQLQTYPASGEGSYQNFISGLGCGGEGESFRLTCRSIRGAV
jgi:hypothetical protein